MLKVAYIASGNKDNQPRKRKPTAAELLHMEALATIAARRIHDKAKAAKMFEPERKELEELRAKRDKLRQQMC